MILPALLLLLPSPQAPETAPSPPRQAWSEAERTKVVDLLRKLDEAKEKGKGERDAKEKLAKAFEEITKRLKLDALACVADLQKVLEGVPKFASNASHPAIGREAECKSVLDPKSKFQFILRLPKGYDAKRAWPLLLVIPPAGEKPDDHLRSAWKDEGLHSGTILAAPEMPPKSADWRKLEGGVTAVMRTFGEVVTQFNVDRDRVVVAGSKEGGAFAVTVVSYYPDRFAGAVSRLGGADGAVFANLGNLPTYFTGGAETTKKVEAAAKELRRDNVTRVEADDLAAVAKWIGERTRNPAPADLAFSPVHAFTRNAYWVKVENFEVLPDYFSAPVNERPLITGKVSRASNTAEFEARGITDFWLFLSDALLDLDKPLKVVVNGKAWEGSYKRELDKFLESRQRSDPRMTYVAWHVSAVPKGSNGAGATGGSAGPRIEPAGAPSGGPRR